MNAPTQTSILSSQTQESAQSALISISEIFGPTIQGEGSLIGSQTVFVRTGGCDYRCDWCDTGYAVLPKFKDDWQMMDAESIFKKIKVLSKQKPMWITLSGGNPAMQNFEALIKLGQEKDYQFSMETQGSIAKTWFSQLDQLTLSPKPPSSKMRFKQRGLDRCIEACNESVELSLKFVVANNEDLIWAKNIAEQYPELPCFVQPCNTQAKLDGEIKSIEITNTDQQTQMLWLIEAVQSLHWHNVRILPQLHSWLWADKRGV